MTPAASPGPARWSLPWWRLAWHALTCRYCRRYEGITAASIHVDAIRRQRNLLAAEPGALTLTADQLAALDWLDAVDCTCPVPPDGDPDHAMVGRRGCPVHFAP